MRKKQFSSVLEEANLKPTKQSKCTFETTSKVPRRVLLVAPLALARRSKQVIPQGKVLTVVFCLACIVAKAMVIIMMGSRCSPRGPFEAQDVQQGAVHPTVVYYVFGEA